MLIDVKANLWFAGAHLVFILNGTMTGVWGGRKIKSNQICRGERKETSVVFASYYTAIFGSLMSEKVKALVLGDGEMHGLPSVMLYTQAERVGSGRASSLLRSVHCSSACTYTSSRRFWGLGKGLRDTYCELKNQNQRLAAKSLRERRQRNQVPCTGTSLQADYCNFNNIHSPLGLLNLQFKTGSDRADFLNVPFADVISFSVVLGGKG